MFHVDVDRKCFISTGGKPVTFFGSSLWVFFQEWIRATCMYIVFIKIIYIAFQEEQRTIHMCGELTLVSASDRETWGKQKRACYLVGEQLSPVSWDPALILCTSVGFCVYYSQYSCLGMKVNVYHRYIWKQSVWCVRRKKSTARRQDGMLREGQSCSESRPVSLTSPWTVGVLEFCGGWCLLVKPTFPTVSLGLAFLLPQSFLLS